MHTSSSGSDVESEEDDGGRKRKRPHQLTSLTRENKSTRLDVRSKSHSTACHKLRSLVSGPPSKAVEVDETKSTLKEISYFPPERCSGKTGKCRG